MHGPGAHEGAIRARHGTPRAAGGAPPKGKSARSMGADWAARGGRRTSGDRRRLVGSLAERGSAASPAGGGLCAPRSQRRRLWTCGRAMDAVRACAYETHRCQEPACLSRQHPHTFGVRGNASLTRAQSPRPRGRSPHSSMCTSATVHCARRQPLASYVLVVALDVLRRGPRSRRGSAEGREEGANCGRTALAVAGPGTASCLFGQLGVTESEKR